MSNLAKANENRDYRILEEFTYQLVAIARKQRQNHDFKIKEQVYAFDYTTIDLCLSDFWWGKFRKQKGGIKLNTLFDVITQIHAVVHVSVVGAHDVNAMDLLVYEPEAYYVFDRGYVDFESLYRITRHSAYFVVRAKTNLCFKSLYSLKSNKEAEVKSDQIGKLTVFYVSEVYLQRLRRVKCYDKDSDTTSVFLSNNFELSAEEMAFLYKNRWQVELFFKWIKQQLKIKAFWGI